MKLPRFRTIAFSLAGVFIIFYALAVLLVAQKEFDPIPEIAPNGKPLSIAIFGASGTAGSGILKAALASNDIENILIITRRDTPFINQALSSAKVERILHQDYLNYQPLRNKLSELDAVYWAIGISAIGAEEDLYANIHVDFPLSFVKLTSQIHLLYLII